MCGMCFKAHTVFWFGYNMKKYVCDYCGKDCDEQLYKIPHYEYVKTWAYDRNGAPLKCFSHYKMKDNYQNLCEDCKEKIARFMYCLPCIEDFNMQGIKFREKE